MADYEKSLEASRSCALGPASIELTAVNLTGDVSEPVVLTSMGMSPQKFEKKSATLAQLVEYANEKANELHSGLPQINPVALWVNTLCLREHHDPRPKNNDITSLGSARLERLFAVMLPRGIVAFEDDRQIENPALSNHIPYAGFASVKGPQSMREWFAGIRYIQPPLTPEEKLSLPKPTSAYLLGKVGKAAVYGIRQLQLDGTRPIAEIVPPSKIAAWNPSKVKFSNLLETYAEPL